MSADFTIPLRNPWHLRWCFASKPPFGLTLANPKIEVDWFSILRYINHYQSNNWEGIFKLRLVEFACIQEAAPPKSPPTAPTAPLATLVRLMPSSPESVSPASYQQNAAIHLLQPFSQCLAAGANQPQGTMFRCWFLKISSKGNMMQHPHSWNIWHDATLAPPSYLRVLHQTFSRPYWGGRVASQKS